MEIEHISLDINTKTPSIDKKVLRDLLLFCLFLLGLIYLSNKNFTLFHTSAELFSSIISFGIFMFAVNTYSISRNDFFMVVGIGSFFIGIIDLLHNFYFIRFNLYPVYSLNTSGQFWIVGRILYALSFLAAIISVYKPIKKSNHYFTFTAFFIVTLLSVGSIIRWDIFPDCYIEGLGITDFMIVLEEIVTFTFAIVAGLLFKYRKKMNHQLFVYIFIATLLNLTAEVFFLFLNNPVEWESLVGHLLKVTASYFIYKGIVHVGLQRPYEKLFYRHKELEITNAKLNVDVNKLMILEQTLINNEKCYELLIENSKDAIYIHSEGTIVFANEASAKLIGVAKPENLIGLEVLNLIYPALREVASKRINSLYINQNSVRYIESKYVNVFGEIINVEVADSYFNYRGKPAILSTVRDITPQKQVESLKRDIKEIKEFNKYITEFFSNISHELKTPLNVILSAIQILALPADDKTPIEPNSKLTKYLKIMKQNSFRLLRLVNNVIDISKFDSGYLNLNLQNLNIINVVENITLSVADYVESKGLNLVFDTDVEEKTTAIDTDKIERIMLNLIANAIKFTNEGGSISVDMQDLGNAVKISVKDTGIGIPEDKLQAIFDRFKQVDRSLSRNREGSGIGLSLVKSLVDLHGGTITAKSTVGEGSEFIVILPTKQVDQKESSENLVFQSNVERINIEFSDIYN